MDLPKQGEVGMMITVDGSDYDDDDDDNEDGLADEGDLPRQGAARMLIGVGESDDDDDEDDYVDEDDERDWWMGVLIGFWIVLDTFTSLVR